MPKKRKGVDVDSDDEYVEEKRSFPTRGVKKVTTNQSYETYSENPTIVASSDAGSSYFDYFQDLSKSLTLKKDHDKRPIWISNNNIIILEAFSKYYTQAYDFLIDIAEPIARPTYFQIYRLTEDSLYSAVAVSRSTDSIIKYLNILCKTEVPYEVENFIRLCTSTFGKAKLVLKNNIFYVESQYPDILRELLKNPNINAARITDTTQLLEQEKTIINITMKDGFVESAAPKEDRREVELLLLENDILNPDINDDEDININDNDDDVEGGQNGVISGWNSKEKDIYVNTLKTVSFMVSQNLVQMVKKCAKEESHYPLLEEYDFRGDFRNPNLLMDLRPSTSIRPYQEKSLSKMFGNGRARSGIIVLPCGAGKSLTGVTAASTVKKATVVLCINNASVKQWKEQFMMWTTVPEKSIKIFTSSNKDSLPPKTEACILITTYSMICHSGRRSESATIMMNSVTDREWGLMVLDEVHVAPADMFQKVLQIVNAHCKLGLTATLVREDNKIKDLSFLVGPKLYEANWIDLTNQNYLARAKCVEVWCPMTKEFYAEYIRCGTSQHSRTQKLLYLLNPRKFRICEYLVKYHIKRGDKIIIFSDDLPALFLYCELLKEIREIPYICGETKEEDRKKYLTAFKTHPEVNCIGLSAVGDTALDIPEANVIIQVSSHFGARRQEAQRLGRILRPKANMRLNPDGYNAFFYSLISTDTKESYFSTKRQQYLIDQGYTFKVVQDLADIADKESVILKTIDQEIALLNKALTFKCDDYDAIENRAVEDAYKGEVDGDDEVLIQLQSKIRPSTGGTSSSSVMTAGSSSSSTVAGSGRRKVSTLGALSGADSLVYSEFSTNKK